MCLKMRGYNFDSKFIKMHEIPIGKKVIGWNSWNDFRKFKRFEPSNIHKIQFYETSFWIDSDRMLVASWLILSSSIYIFFLCGKWLIRELLHWSKHLFMFMGNWQRKKNDWLYPWFKRFRHIFKGRLLFVLEYYYEIDKIAINQINDSFT